MCSWIAAHRANIDVDAVHQLGNSDIPSIEEIQQTLVNINDKPPEFLNSTDWLGALEVRSSIRYGFFFWPGKLKIKMWLMNLLCSWFADLLCDWHAVWYIMSHSAYPQLPWHPQIFQYHKILFWKFRRPNHDGWRFGCIIKMYCGHSHSR